jgi:ankyrin repeat protein
LGLACCNGYYPEGHVPLLEMLRVLVEGGGDTSEKSYQNHWGARPGEAKRRSAIHYLLYQTPGKRNSFDSKVSTALCDVIKAFLIHGADLNAVDSDGKSILECALPYAPYELIEFMLKKGAKITPSLLSPSGEPSQDANGILEEERWRRIECYTPEAREIARKYNPHWGDSEVEEVLPATVQGVTLGGLGRLRGWISGRWMG